MSRNESEFLLFPLCALCVLTQYKGQICLGDGGVFLDPPDSNAMLVVPVNGTRLPNAKCVLVQYG